MREVARIKEVILSGSPPRRCGVSKNTEREGSSLYRKRTNKNLKAEWGWE